MLIWALVVKTLSQMVYGTSSLNTNYYWVTNFHNISSILTMISIRYHDSSFWSPLQSKALSDFITGRALSNHTIPFQALIRYHTGILYENIHSQHQVPAKAAKGGLNSKWTRFFHRGASLTIIYIYQSGAVSREILQI